jgi:hypothetical protein
MSSLSDLCNQFAETLGGKGKVQKGVCKVSLGRNIPVSVQGKQSKSLFPADVWFEALDQQGNALNMGEIAILQKEVPGFMYAIVQQGITVSALHNHWLFTDPVIMYIHLQSIEPPLHFAQKVANAFSTLQYPVSSD